MSFVGPRRPVFLQKVAIGEETPCWPHCWDSSVIRMAPPVPLTLAVVAWRRRRLLLVMLMPSFQLCAEFEVPQAAW